MNKESLLKKSWGAFDQPHAQEYLKTFGSPSVGSKQILFEILKEKFTSPLKILDMGCGNGQIFEYFKSQGLEMSYTGVDFSESLLEAARTQNPDATFIADNIIEPQRLPLEKFDVVIFSHVIEMLDCPEKALASAKAAGHKIIIRFFEPPIHDFDTVELLEMNVSETQKVPYLRRKISKDYYSLILSKLGCKKVEIFLDPSSRDQIHVLFFD